MTFRVRQVSVAIMGLLVAGCGMATAPVFHTGGKRPSHGRTTAVGQVGTASTPTGFLTGMHFVSRSTGWVWGISASQSYVLLRTEDGGSIWTKLLVPVQLRSVSGGAIPGATPPFFLNAREGWLMGQTATGKVMVYHTTDGGDSWSLLNPGIAVPVGSFIGPVSFAGPQRGWMMIESSVAMSRSQKVIYETADGGRTWRVLSVDTGYVPSDLPTTPNAVPEYTANGMVFEQSGVGWVSENDPFAPPLSVNLYRTTDGGHSWFRQPVSIPPQAGHDYSITYAPIMFGSSGCLVVSLPGGNPMIATYVTDNRGDSWRMTAQLSSDSQSPLVSFSDASHGLLLLADPERLYKTSDGGIRWIGVPMSVMLKRSIRTSWAPVALAQTSQMTGWLLLVQNSVISYNLSRSLLMKTSNGGKLWTIVHITPP